MLTFIQKRTQTMGMALLVSAAIFSSACTTANALPQDGAQPSGFLLARIIPALASLNSGPVKRIFQSANVSIVGQIGAGGTTGADTLCNSDGNKPNTSNYKALVSDAAGAGSRIACTTANCTTSGAGENFDWPLAANTTYYRADGVTVLFTTDASGIFVFGAMTNSFSGAVTQFWSGLNADWTGAANHCTDWTNGGGGNGRAGTLNLTGSGAIATGDTACTTGLSILCVEQ